MLAGIVVARVDTEINFLPAETAFYCRYQGDTKDEKAPGVVGEPYTFSTIEYCPVSATDFVAGEADPRWWSLRIMFDELLDADKVETFVGPEGDPVFPPTSNSSPEDILRWESRSGSLALTQPVAIRCAGGDVGYDGYYIPNGNNVTFPVGPSLWIEPDDADLTAPTGSSCTVHINDVVVDKSGTGVSPADVDVLSFDLADLAIIETDPADDPSDPAVIGATGEIAFAFNAYMDPATLDAADFEVVDSNGTPVNADAYVDDVYGYYLPGDSIWIYSTDVDGFAVGSYTARIKSSATLSELNGGTLSLAGDAEVNFIVE